MGFSIGQYLLKHIDTQMINIEDFFPQASGVLDESERTNLCKYGLTFGFFYNVYGEYAKAADVFRQCLARRNNGIATNDSLARTLLARLGDTMRCMENTKKQKTFLGRLCTWPEKPTWKDMKIHYIT
jgi:hypothetical protein